MDDTSTEAASTTATVDDLEALRGPLTGYCYRMLGSATDTDDAVSEAIIRAHRNLDHFDPRRGRLSTWTHRIATNVCLDMLRSAKRRALLLDVPAADSGDIGAPLSPTTWVEPMPDSRLFATTDPGDLVAARESVRLAFIAALQHLAPRQRAVLILRDVLGYSAAETADVIDTSVAAVNSALQRARSTLAEVRPQPAAVFDPDDAAQADLLKRYVDAFESHDIAALTAVLRDDAIASMPPFAWWIAGGPRIAALMGDADACAGARLQPTTINGSPGFGQYRPSPDGGFAPFALMLVEIADGTVAHTITFLGTADRFVEFGLPAGGEEFRLNAMSS